MKKNVLRRVEKVLKKENIKYDYNEDKTNIGIAYRSDDCPYPLLQIIRTLDNSLIFETVFMGENINVNYDSFGHFMELNDSIPFGTFVSNEGKLSFKSSIYSRTRLPEKDVIFYHHNLGLMMMNECSKYVEEGYIYKEKDGDVMFM